MHARRETETDGASSVARPRTRAQRPEERPPQVLALQRTAGNAAVVQMMRNRNTGGHGIAGLVANTGAAEREAQLSATYGIRIGPPADRPNDHFSHSMLNRIDGVLGSLPPADVRDNPELVAIQPAGADTTSAASLYDGGDRSITMVSPFGMPSWLYTELNRGVPWQRSLMDKGAMADYEGISDTEDQALGIAGERRQVMGGVSDVLANGNLVKWTLRHEIGHSVDQLTGWEVNLKHEPRFGGWEAYDDARPVAVAILTEAGLGDRLETEDRYHMTLVDSVATALDPEVARDSPQRLTELADNFPTQGQGFKERLARVVRFGRLALAQPWTLTDGGGDTLAIGPRTYHVDHYGHWVSYLRAQRQQHAVSNYQFSTPEEWFAEAYAAYHDPKPGPRARLHPEARDWFAERGA
ncbi:hypothetical protein [Streptomyces showdoensis]|uniref:hypothetical protein n=1 Tax=Streptomyces showdoensis TaxID=68268 RepID=UPI00103C574D|nr:hypothetical protein [Streptomyces showdoensis]